MGRCWYCAELAVETALLDSPHAELAPLGDGQGFDQRELRCSDGLEFEDVGFEQREETLLGFRFQNDSADGEAMPGAVARGGLFSPCRDRTFGKGSVGSRGLNLFDGSHLRFLYISWTGARE